MFLEGKETVMLLIRTVAQDTITTHPIRETRPNILRSHNARAEGGSHRSIGCTFQVVSSLDLDFRPRTLGSFLRGFFHRFEFLFLFPLSLPLHSVIST